VHDESVPPLWGGFRLTAEIEAPGAATQGVVCALGDWFGGYALYVTDGIVRFAFARAADALELEAMAPLLAGPHRIDVAYALGQAGAPGRMVLLVDDTAVDAIDVEGILPIALQHGGAGLRLGRDAGFPVAARYTPPAPFNGEVRHVTIDTPGTPVPGPADEIRAALHGD
jgi:arylsulfatase